MIEKIRTRLSKLSKKNIIVISIVALAVVLIAGITFSYYAQRKEGWKQEYSMSPLSYSLNNVKVGDDNTVSETYKFARGEEIDLPLNAKAEGVASGSFSVAYYIDFSVESENSLISQAIEVYELTDDGYTYIDTLDKFIADKSTVNNHNIENELGANQEQMHHFKLVYSLGAGSELEGVSFTLNVTSGYNINSQSENYYVITEHDLIIASQSDSIEGKNIVLLNDITLSEDIVFSKKIGFSLGNYTISLNNYNLTVDYTGHNDAYNDLGLTSDNGNVIGGGNFTINCPDDIYNIDDEFLDNSCIKINSYSFDALKNALQSQLTLLCLDEYEDGTEMPFLYGYRIYFEESQCISPSSIIGDNEESISETTINNMKTFTVTSGEFTSIKNVYFSILRSDGSNGAITGSFNALGSTPDSKAMDLANSLIDEIPETVNSSLYFAKYDSQTKAHITWVTENSQLLNVDGIFLKDGYDDLDSWVNQNIEIGVIVEIDGERAYSSKNIELCILTPEERTNLIFRYAALSVSENSKTLDLNVSRNENVYTGLSEAYYMLTPEALSSICLKAGLVSVNMSVDDVTLSSENPNYNSNSTEESKMYLGNTSTGVQMLSEPSVSKSVSVPTTITFTYEDGTYVPENTNVSVIGKLANISQVDVTPELQQKVNNAEIIYRDSDSHKMYVDAFLDDNGNMVDYSLSDESSSASSYIRITNGLWQKDSNGGYILDENNKFVFVGNDENIQGERYTRKTLIEVLPSNAPNTTNTINLTAKIVNNSDSFVYETTNEYKDANYKTSNIDSATYLDATYHLEKSIIGYYHFVDYADAKGNIIKAEIPDYTLYKKLCTYYDINNDSWIDVDEAKLTMSELKVAASSENGLSYIDLSMTSTNINDSISDISGLQYFNGCTGIKLSGNTVSSIDSLEYLSGIRYLDLSNNKISDITPLQYMDNLEYLDLSNSDGSKANNNISDLTPLQYLEKIRVLNLKYNEDIKNIAPIENYMSIEKLNIFQDSSSLLNENSANAYYLTLIAANNASVSILIDKNDNARTYTESAKKAAKALSQLVETNETYNTLYLPTNYVYEGTTYKIAYSTQSSYLVFENDSDGFTTGYEIKSHVVDQLATVSVSICENALGENKFVRSFDINLLALYDSSVSGAYIEIKDENGDIYAELAENVVNDSVLRSELFNQFNTTVDGTYTAVIKSGDTTQQVEIPQAYIITQNEINNNSVNLNLTDAGITDLTGIEYFAGDKDNSNSGITELNISNNTINNIEITDANGEIIETSPDITPLSELYNLKKLVLSGQKYDFSMLSQYIQTSSYDSSTSQFVYEDVSVGGLRNLESLTVAGCYIAEDDLAGLYQVYLANVNCIIYKESVTAAWNPYLIPLAKYANSLPDEFNFIDINDEANMFKDGETYRVNVIEAGGEYYYKFNFYNIRDIYFRIAKSSGSIKATFFENSDVKAANIIQTTATGFKYNNLAAYSDSFYAQITLSGAEGTARTTDIQASHYVQFKVDFNYKIKMKFSDMSEYQNLEQLFPGRDLRKMVMNYINKTAAYKTALQNKNYEFSNTDNLAIGESLEVKGAFADIGDSNIQGLQYTSIKTLTIDRDGNLGDGTYLKNLTTITIQYSGVDLSTIKNKLDNLVTLNIGNGSAGNIYVNMYDTSIAADSEKYLDELCLASEEGAAIDWDSLRQFARSKDPDGQYYFYLNYFPNLKSLTIGNGSINDWRGLLGLLFKSDEITGDCDKNNLNSFNNASAGSNWGNSYRNGKHVEPIIRQLYLYNADYINNGTVPSYYIGTKADAKDADKTIYNPTTFHQNPEAHDPYLYSSTNSANGLTYERNTETNGTNKNYTGIISASGEKTEFANKVTDFGVLIGSEYYNATNQIAEQGISVTLPGATGSFIYGSDDNSDIFGTNRSFGITWSTLNTDYTMPTADADGNYVVTNNYVNEKYVVFCGTINGTENKIYYPVLFKGSTSVSPSYSAISDPALRFGIFLQLNKKTTMESSDVSAITEFNYNTLKTNNPELKDYFSGVSSLAGLEQFTSVTKIIMEDEYISSVPSNLPTGITDIDLSGNLISTVDLSGLTSLTNLDLSDNILKSESYTLPESIAKLDLSGNALINSSDVAGLSGFSSLNVLDVSDTKAVGDLQTLTALQTMLGSRESICYYATSNLKCNEGVFSEDALNNITLANITDFIGYLNGKSTDANFNDLINTAGFSYDNVNFSFSNIVNFKNVYVYNGTSFVNRDKKELQTNIEVISNSHSQLTGVRSVLITFIRANQPNIKIGSVQYAASTFDSAMYAYLTSLGSYSESTGCIEISSLSSIEISTDIDLKSLKGIDAISGITSISVLNNDITELGWTQTMNSLESLTIGNCKIDESAFGTSLSSTIIPNVKTIDFSSCSGIDYSTLSSSINSMNALTTLKIDNEYNYFGVYSSDVSINDMAYSQASSLLFGTGGKTIGGITAIEIMKSGSSKNYYSRNAYVKNMLNYKLWSDMKNFCYSHEERAEFTSIINVTKGTLTSKCGFFNNLFSYLDKEITYEKKPESGTYIEKTLYYDDFANEKYSNDGGVQFYLPTKFNLYGREWSVEWISSDKLISSDAEHSCSLFKIDYNTPGVVNFENGKEIKIEYILSSEGTSITGNFVLNVKKNKSDINWSDYNATNNINTSLDFFLEDEYGRIVNANTYFTSSRLLYYIYGTIHVNNLKSINTSNLCDYDKQKYADKKYLPHSVVLSLKEISISNQGVTTLDGMEIFKNLQEFSLEAGYPISIEQLSNMKLTKFEYGNSYNGVNNIINDWSPLYNSRDTLTDFKYNIQVGKSEPQGSQYDDLGFLMGFTSLKNVTIGSNSTKTEEVTKNPKQNEISGFKYMISWFAKHNKELTFTYGGKTLLSGGSYTADSGVTTDIDKAEQFFEKFTATPDCDIEYLNNFEIAINSNKSSDYILPSYIDYGGQKYYLKWESLSAFVDINSDTVPRKEEDYFSTTADYSWTMNLVDSSKNSINQAYILCRIMVDGNVYERVFTLDCSMVKYPCIKLRDGFGAIELPGAYTVESGSCTAENKNGYTYLLLGENAQSPIYVNDGTNVIPVYFEWTDNDRNDVITFVSEMQSWLESDKLNSIISDGENWSSEYEEATTIYQHYLQLTTGQLNYYHAMTSIKLQQSFENGLDEILDKIRTVEGDITLLKDYKSKVIALYPGKVNEVNVIYSNAIAAYKNGTELSFKDYEQLINDAVGMKFTSYSVIYSNSSSYDNPNTLTYSPLSGEVTLGAPVKNNYIFKGWYTDSSFTNKIESLSLDAFGENDSLILYPKFEVFIADEYYIVVGGDNSSNWTEVTGVKKLLNAIDTNDTEMNTAKTSYFADAYSGSTTYAVQHINIAANTSVYLYGVAGTNCALLDSGTTPITAAYNFYYNPDYSSSDWNNNCGLTRVKAEYYTISGYSTYSGFSGVTSDKSPYPVNNKEDMDDTIYTMSGYYGYMYNDTYGYYNTFDALKPGEEQLTFYAVTVRNDRKNYTHDGADKSTTNPYTLKAYTIFFDPNGKLDKSSPTSAQYKYMTTLVNDYRNSFATASGNYMIRLTYKAKNTISGASGTTNLRTVITATEANMLLYIPDDTIGADEELKRQKSE